VKTSELMNWFSRIINCKKMIEVFKTNVEDEDHAGLIVTEIQKAFPSYLANFDLEDCDRILRIASKRQVDAEALITLLAALGYHAEVLPDEVPSFAI
jgi:hypothetical protein